MRKKLVFWLVLVLSIATFLAACAPSAEPEQPTPEATVAKEATEPEKEATEPKEEITLTVWWLSSASPEGEEKWWKESAAKYEEKHPQVNVETVLKSMENFFPAWSAAAEAQSGPPDIQYFWEGVWMLPDAWAGNIVPISDYWSEEEFDHLPVDLTSITYNDKVWVAPLGADALWLYYNKEIFEEAGLEPDRDPMEPMSWDEFIEACEKIEAEGYHCLAGGMKGGHLGGFFFSAFAEQNFDHPFDLFPVWIGEEDITDPKYSNWWNKVAELRDKEYFNDDINSLELWESYQRYFATGKAGMTFGSFTGMHPVVEEMGDKAGVMLQMPKFGNGDLANRTTFIKNANYGISSWSPNKEEAADFLLFLHTPERLNAFYEDTGLLPLDDRFDESLIKEDYEKMAWEQTMFEGATPWLEDWAPAMVGSEAYWAGGQNLFAGSSVEEVIQNSADVLEKWREEQPEQVDHFREWMQEGKK